MRRMAGSSSTSRTSGRSEDSLTGADMGTHLGEDRKGTPNLSCVRRCTSSGLRHRGLASGLLQETNQRRRIEVEHLGPGELPPKDPVQTQHLPIKCDPTGSDSSLPPECHDLVLTGSHDAG